MKRTGKPHGDLVGQMKLFHVFSLRNSWSANDLVAIRSILVCRWVLLPPPG